MMRNKWLFGSVVLLVAGLVFMAACASGGTSGSTVSNTAAGPGGGATGGSAAAAASGSTAQAPGGPGSSSTAAAVSGQQVALKYAFKAGDTWVNEITLTLKGGVTGGSGDTGSSEAQGDTTMKMHVTSTVQDVAGGVATIVQHYDSVESTEAGQSSSTPTEIPDVTIKMDASGKVLENSAMSGVGASSSSASSSPIDPTSFTSQFAPTYPDSGKATVGEQWTSKVAMPIPGANKKPVTTMTSKLVSVSQQGGRQIATIDYTADAPLDLTFDLGEMMKQMSSALGSTDSTAGDLSFKMAMTGSIQAHLVAKVDTATGRPVTTDGPMSLKVEIDITDAPEALVPQDQRGPIKMDVQMTEQLTEMGAAQ